MWGATIGLMQFADLVFVIALCAIVASIGRVLWRLVRGPRASAVGPFLQGAAIAGCYGAALLGASAIQPGRTVPLGVDECFDDWCIAVTAVRAPIPTATRLTVMLRVSNRGRGRAQAEPDARVYLRDLRGRRLDPVEEASVERSIGDTVPAGESREVEVTFDVPTDFEVAGLVKTRRFNFPQIVLIGDPSSLFHRPTVHDLGLVSTPRVTAAVRAGSASWPRSKASSAARLDAVEYVAAMRVPPIPFTETTITVAQVRGR